MHLPKIWDEQGDHVEFLHFEHLHFPHRALHCTTNCIEQYGVTGMEVYWYEYSDPGIGILHWVESDKRGRGVWSSHLKGHLALA